MAKGQQFRRTFLREWRQAKGFDLAKIADASGYSEGYLSLVETRKRRYNQDILEAYEEVLGVPGPIMLSRPPPKADDEPDITDPDVLAGILESMDPRDRRRAAGIIRQLSEPIDE